MNITLTLRTDDAEPYLREAAFEAARYGAWCDYITRRTWNAPSWTGSLDERRKEWSARFLKAKRIVEAFGVEYEPTSEGETLTVHIPDKVLKSKIRTIAGMSFREVLKSVPDPKNAGPSYRAAIHEEACRQAASRVVRRWRESLLAGAEIA